MANMTSRLGQSAERFQFERDTVTFANELVWQYQFDPVTGAMSVSPNRPSPTYSHRCFVLVRSVRQSLYHARFDAAQPEADEQSYRRLIRQVVRRSPRHESEPGERIVFPGYGCLREFSRDHEALLKAECGGAWQSYFLRSHWRMVFPVWGRHQARMARKLSRAVLQGAVPAVHLFRFPRITINHGILLYATEESESEIEFEAYDPNIPAHPVTLSYDRASRSFHFPPASYWAGGKLSVVEVFRGGGR